MRKKQDRKEKEKAKKDEAKKAIVEHLDGVEHDALLDRALEVYLEVDQQVMAGGSVDYRIQKANFFLQLRILKELAKLQ